MSDGLHTLWPVSVSKKASCESTPVTSESRECASLRIRSFRITRPQISASIPSETDYPGLSQTQRIITGSPLGHCSLPAPRLEMHRWARCQRWLGGNTGYSLTLACTKTTDKQFFLLLVSCCCCFCLSTFSSLPFSHFSSSLLICSIRSASLSQTWFQTELSCLPFLSLFQVLPFRTLLAFPFSTLHFCFINPVSALPLPLVACL